MRQQSEFPSEAAATERRIQIAPAATPRAAVRGQVNDIVTLMRGLVDRVRRSPEAFNPEEGAKIGLYLTAQASRVGEDIDQILAGDAAAFDRFDFDMPIAAPQTRREPRPSQPLVSASQPPAPPPVAPVQATPAQTSIAAPGTPGPQVVLGRMSKAAGGGIAVGAPPPPTRPDTGAIGGCDFLDEKE